ncbi:phosphonate ABC transporter, permease protein PhnE [Dendrosporobacter sp. 1207_IL3150]|uniref:phosphonate ABC transporter, permease protein PhnE n=1 Tax=Dendrosporobacter sp. 1207_IL3150 TaxID=3084054 RepID=UPI002FDAAAB0
MNNILNLIITLGVLVSIFYSGIDTGVSLGVLFEPKNIKAVQRFLTGLWPIETDAAFLLQTFKLLIETVEISLVSTAIAIVLALPLSIASIRPQGEEFTLKRLGMSEWTLRWILYYTVRSLLGLLRGIPELMWALIFVVAVGLGPFPGILALAAHSTGILGKLYSEMFEAVDSRLIETVRSSGSSQFQEFIFVRFPMSLSIFLSYTLFRWECNLRAATILGFVGAGGIGTQLIISMKLFMYHEVSTLIIAILLLVITLELMGQYVRARILTGNEGSGPRKS